MSRSGRGAAPMAHNEQRRGFEMTDAIEILRRDHDEIRRLLDAIEAALPGHEAAVPGARDRRLAALVEQVIMDESGHEAIEEQYFWPLIRRRVQDGSRLADQAIGQEQDVKHVLCQLEKHDREHIGFEALIRRFLTIGRAHIDFEETRVWPGVRLALSEQELDELGDQLTQGKKLAPTRPHPNMRPTAEVLKVVAPIAGATDWIRDVLAGRKSH
jgi:hemerythrin-like domain-containing protein